MTGLSIIPKKCYWILILFSICHSSYAQVVVSGRVVDASDGSEIPGATILIKGTTSGTVTDFDGNFRLEVPGPNAVLVFNFLGYEEQEVVVGERSVIDIGLSPDLKSLDEVVVIGYGVQRKKEVTGSVSSVKSDLISQTATNDLNASLQGVISGVNVQASSGSPGAVANIQIRGVGSFTGAAAAPLYVVDGIPYASNPNLSTAEIESVVILKDGAAAAIYGTRASNGVILITTKIGEVGKVKFDYNAYYGIQNITSGVPLMNTAEQLYSEEVAQRQLDGTRSEKVTLNAGALDRNVDFVGAVLNDNAVIQNHNVSVSGGLENIAYAAIIDYFSQDGVLKNSDYERLSARLNSRIQKGKFKGFTSVAIRGVKSNHEPFGIYQRAIAQKPYQPLPVGSGEVFVPFENPQNIGGFASLLGNTDKRSSTDANGALSLKYEIVKGLSYQMRTGGNLTYFTRDYWQPRYIVRAQNGEIENLSSRVDAVLQETHNVATKWTMENLISYEKKIKNHNLSVLIGYTAERGTFRQTVVQKSDFLSNSKPVFNAANENNSINGFNRANTIVGALGRLTYNYKGKYIFSASVRRDGSSRFGPGRKFGVFPGYSMGWNLSQEGFYAKSGFSSVVDDIKLRASLAEVGNQNIGDYGFEAQVVQGSNYPFGPDGTAVLEPGTSQRGYANEFLQWETNISRNLGMDVSILNGKITLVVDAYKNSKKDMLVPVEVSPSAGTRVPNTDAYDNVTRNIGNMINQGIEAALTYSKRSTDFDWSVNAIFSKNKNEVVSLPDDAGRFSLGGGNPIPFGPSNRNTTFLIEGGPVASFLLIPTEGTIKDEETLNAYNASITGGGFQLGDLMYTDVNGDSTIDDHDRVFSGSGTPKFEMGLGFNATYKNFDGYIQLYYSNGAKVYNGSKVYAYQTGRHKDVYYQWQPGNDDSEIPANRKNGDHSNFATWSDYFLEDATYLRVRNITIGYSIPPALFNDKVSKIRCYLSAQNPFTITKYTGFDPEVGYTQSPDPRGGGGRTLFNRGVDRGNYPISRRFIAGLQVNF